MEKALDEIARILVDSKHAVALTGAGISVDSGVPDFRSPGGLWERFNPMEYAHIEAFIHDPIKVWGMLKEMESVVRNAKPNAGHIGLADLEKMGIIKAVVTQNIDNLHKAAGSKIVIEFHGSTQSLVCLRCNTYYDAEEVRNRAEAEGEFPPTCFKCGNILKPNVVFFGEGIPAKAMAEATRHAYECDTMMVIGTSATVYPASSLPIIARQNEAILIEINTTPTVLTENVANYTILGSATEVMPGIVERVRKLLN